MVAGALATAAFVAAMLSWFYALVRGRVPRGLRNLGAFELRYAAQTYGYPTCSPTAIRTAVPPPAGR